MIAGVEIDNWRPWPMPRRSRGRLFGCRDMPIACQWTEPSSVLKGRGIRHARDTCQSNRWGLSPPIRLASRWHSGRVKSRPFSTQKRIEGDCPLRFVLCSIWMPGGYSITRRRLQLGQMPRGADARSSMSRPPSMTERQTPHVVSASFPMATPPVLAAVLS